MVGVKVTDADGQNQFVQTLKPNDSTLDDCCQVAKDVFNDKVSSLIKETGTGRQQELLPDLINIDNLSCVDFQQMLASLFSIKGSGGGDLLTATTQAVNKYIRLDKVPTSMFNTVASIIKQAGAEAYEAWIKCQEKSNLNMTDNDWQSTLMRSNDNKFNTWDNILLDAYKPLEDSQKGILKKDFNKLNEFHTKMKEEFGEKASDHLYLFMAVMDERARNNILNNIDAYIEEMKLERTKENRPKKETDGLTNRQRKENRKAKRKQIKEGKPTPINSKPKKEEDFDPFKQIDDKRRDSRGRLI
tara:strand:- start:758 stop:1660 length:903 start_codon:yes stop_codon:yes gene_type:complete